MNSGQEIASGRKVHTAHRENVQTNRACGSAQTQQAAARSKDRANGTYSLKPDAIGVTSRQARRIQRQGETADRGATQPRTASSVWTDLLAASGSSFEGEIAVG